MKNQKPAGSLSCNFCGAGCANRHGLSIHTVRCASNPGRKVWSRSGVKNGMHGPKKPRTNARGEEPTSVCCGAKVYEGARHENGNRYCKACDDPCFWRSNLPLATVWSCKTRTCKSFVHWRDGYCKRCWEKGNKTKKSDLDFDPDEAII